MKADQSNQFTFCVMESQVSQFASIGQFLQENLFSDCTILYDEKRFNCHKIILSKYSKWFKDYFASNGKGEAISLVRVPLNEYGSLFTLINSIYSQKLQITPFTAPILYITARFYHMGTILPEISKYIFANTSPIGIISLSRVFISHGVDPLNEVEYKPFSEEFLREFCPIISKQFSSEAPRQRQAILSSISATILARTLTAFPHSSLPEKKKVAIIDQFATFHPKLSEDEVICLSSIVNWDSPESYRFLLSNECGWLEPIVTRRAISKIIDRRRASISSFREDARSGCPKLGRLYTFAWLSSIHSAQADLSSPEVSLRNSFTTMNPLPSQIDPFAFSFFSLSSTAPLYKWFEARNIFSDENYYLSKDGSRTDPPYISIGFGPNSHFEAKKIIVNSHIPKSDKANRFGPKYLSLSAKLDNGEKIDFPRLEFNADGIAVAEFDANKQYSEFRLEMAEASAGNGWNLRIKDLDIVGRFLH